MNGFYPGIAKQSLSQPKKSLQLLHGKAGSGELLLGSGRGGRFGFHVGLRSIALLAPLEEGLVVGVGGIRGDTLVCIRTKNRSFLKLVNHSSADTETTELALGLKQLVDVVAVNPAPPILMLVPPNSYRVLDAEEIVPKEEPVSAPIFLIVPVKATVGVARMGTERFQSAQAEVKLLP